MGKIFGAISKGLALKLGIVFAFIILINGLYVSYQAQSFEPLVQEIGDKVFGSLVDLNDQFIIVAENQQIILPESETWFTRTLDIFTTYTTIFWGFFSFFLWVKVFKYLLGASDDSNHQRNYFIATIIVLLGNGIYIASTIGGAGLSIYFDIFKNFWSAFPYLFEPLKDVADAYYLQGNTSFQDINISGLLLK